MPELPDGPDAAQIVLTAGASSLTLVPAAGGRASSLVVEGVQLLAHDSDTAVGWGWYPMAPWPGRLRDNALVFRGVTYPRPVSQDTWAIHGTVYDVPWRVDSLEPGNDLQPASAVYGAHARNRIPGLGSVAAGIHCQCATHGAGNAGEKLRALEVVGCRKARYFRTGHARFRIDLGVAGTFFQKQARKNAMRKHNCSAKTSIPDQQIAAKPDEENRFVFREAAEKYAEIVEICGRVRAIDDPAGSPADMLAHRLVAPEFATQSSGLDLSEFCMCMLVGSGPFC